MVELYDHRALGAARPVLDRVEAVEVEMLTHFLVWIVPLHMGLMASMGSVPMVDVSSQLFGIPGGTKMSIMSLLDVSSIAFRRKDIEAHRRCLLPRLSQAGRHFLRR